MAKISLLISLTCLLALVYADGLYSKSSPVLQVTGKTYESLIAQSNHTSILEFYAPWCGHCKNLKPAYEKAAKTLSGLAKVAAINCDDEPNKAFCGSMGVQGFPTLKIIKPGKRPGRPLVEDYRGERTTKAIVDAVVDKIPNHVKRLQDKDLDTWLESSKGTPKAILFSEKGTVSALIKSLAVDFLGGIDIAQIRSKETAAVEKFGITQFPSLVLIQDHEQEPVKYDGEMKREALIAFLGQATPPNPDPAPKKAKSTISSKMSPKVASSSSTASSEFSKASEAHQSQDYEDLFNNAGTIILDDDTPTDSPLPIVSPAETPIAEPKPAPAIPVLATAAEVSAACLSPNSGNCILVLSPKVDTESILPQVARDVLGRLAEIAEKHAKRKTKIFPFYSIPADNEAAKIIRESLGLKPETELEVIAVNMKRKWWRPYTGQEHNLASIDRFVDGIKLGEGAKQSLPASFFAQDSEETKAEPVEAVSEPHPEPEPETEVPTVAEPAEPTMEFVHNEL